MNTIAVHIPAVPASTYEVRIAPGLLAQLGPIARSLAPAPSTAIISDSNVAPLYLAAAKASLASAGYRVIDHIIPAGEQHKTLATASAALDTLLSAAVGGSKGQPPSSPSAAESSETSPVSFPLPSSAEPPSSRSPPPSSPPSTPPSAAKSASTTPSEKTSSAPSTSPKSSSPTSPPSPPSPRELNAGLAECVKHAVIRDPALFTFISTHLEKILACDSATLAHLVSQNVAIKAAIVHEDPFEKSVRALLNFGHTFGHAIENVLHYSGLIHGEAVALGMIAAARLAHARNEFPAEDLQKLTALLHRIGLPTARPDLDLDQTLAAMATDKKVRSGKLRFILPTKIGHAHIVSDIPPDQIRIALASLKNPANP